MKINTRDDLIGLMNYLGLPKTICEVGVAEGIFSEQMYNWGLEKLYLIDIWRNIPFIPGCASFEQSWHDRNYNLVKEKFSGKENVEILKGFSFELAGCIPNESLGLCYIDGDHSYAGVKTDILAFYQKLVKGGILCLHDVFNADYGVGKAMQETFGTDRINVLIENGNIANMGAYIIKQ